MSNYLIDQVYEQLEKMSKELVEARNTIAAQKLMIAAHKLTIEGMNSDSAARSQVDTDAQ